MKLKDRNMLGFRKQKYADLRKSLQSFFVTLLLKSVVASTYFFFKSCHIGVVCFSLLMSVFFFIQCSGRPLAVAVKKPLREWLAWLPVPCLLINDLLLELATNLKSDGGGGLGRGGMKQNEHQTKREDAKNNFLPVATILRLRMSSFFSA